MITTTSPQVNRADLSLIFEHLSMNLGSTSELIEEALEELPAVRRAAIMDWLTERGAETDGMFLWHHAFLLEEAELDQMIKDFNRSPARIVKTAGSDPIPPIV